MNTTHKKEKDAPPLSGEKALDSVHGSSQDESALSEGIAWIAEKIEEPAKPRKYFFKHKNVNDGQKSFADGLNLYKILWVFIIGCVLGVIIETLYVYATTGVWMRRSGMLYGPFNQIYGFGAVLFTVLLYRYRNRNSMVIFLAGGTIGLVFEYLCSLIQELVFGSVSWEYSEMSTNIGGRTNLMYGVGWGILGLLFITQFWPFMSEIIERIPNKIGKTLTIVVSVVLALNLALSGAAVLRQRLRTEGHAPLTFIGAWLDATYPDEVMAEKYPSMEFVSSNKSTSQ
ncbi:MAG: putative ABC transporter permease [Oscillospiraceae bacterium]